MPRAMHRRTSIGFVGGLVALLALGCSNTPTGPDATNRNLARFGPGSQGASPSVPYLGRVGSTIPLPNEARPTFRWHYTLAGAQAAARQSGRMILAASTSPTCTLCEHFKNVVVPQNQDLVARKAVGYLYDIRQPESGAVDTVLRGANPGATHMPLVGVLTPELGVRGALSGRIDPARFRALLAGIQVAYVPPAPTPRVPAMGPVSPPSTGPLSTVRNEFGEPELVAPGDLAPTDAPPPEDAITGRPPAVGRGPTVGAPPPAVPSSPADTPSHTPDLPPVRPDQPIPPAGTPAQPPPPTTTPIGDSPTLPPVSSPTLPPVSSPTLPPVNRPTPPPMTSPAPPPMTSPAPPPVGSRPASPTRPASSPRPAAVTADTVRWAEQQLGSAAEAIRRADYDAARRALQDVQGRLAGHALAQEAGKGFAAIYNHKRVAGATGSDRDAIRSRARADLAGSRWTSLFE